MAARIDPALIYRDPAAAVAWLCRAFGFQEGLIARSPGGAIVHAELKLDEDAIMLGGAKPDTGWLSPRDLPGTSQVVYVAVDDIDALFGRARDAGAEIVVPLGETSYGSREFMVKDLEAHSWSFGTYRPK